MIKRYVSPHPPGNFHAIRSDPSLEGDRVTCNKVYNQSKYTITKVYKLYL